MGLDIVELVMKVEKEFALQIPNDIAEKLDTVGKLYNYVCHHHGLNPDLSDAEIWDKLVDMVCYQLGVAPERVKKESHWVYDLGAD